MTDGIFNRAHSIERPGPHDDLPIVIEENPSRDMVFPTSADKITERIRVLPHQDTAGITHLWLRRAKPGEHESGNVPFAEFICGSGVRMIVVYPWPADLTLRFGRSPPRPSNSESTPPGRQTSVAVRMGGRWCGQPKPWSAGAWITSLFTRSVIMSTGTAGAGHERIDGRPRLLPSHTLLAGRRVASRHTSATQQSTGAHSPRVRYHYGSAVWHLFASRAPSLLRRPPYIGPNERGACPSRDSSTGPIVGKVVAGVPTDRAPRTSLTIDRSERDSPGDRPCMWRPQHTLHLPDS